MSSTQTLLSLSLSSISVISLVASGCVMAMMFCVSPLPVSYLGIHQNATTEGVLTPVILRLTASPLAYARRAENGDDATALADVDALLRRLVCAHDVRHAVGVQEVLDGLVTVADGSRAALALAEAGTIQPLLLLVLRRVRPQEVAGELLDLLGTRVGGGHADRRGTRDLVDALERRLLGGERTRNATMHAEDDVVDGGCEGHVVEDGVGHRPDDLPLVHAVAALQLAQEAAVAIVGLPAVPL